MKVELSRYSPEHGWSPAPDARLDGEQTLVLCFTDLPSTQSKVLLDELRQLFPRSRMAGCSTAGQIHQDHFSSEAATLAVIRFDRCRIELAHVEVDEGSDFRAAGRALMEAIDQPDLAAVLILAEGLKVNGSALMEGVNQWLGGRVPVTGGLAADGDRFESTWVYCQDELAVGRVCAVAVLGEGLEVRSGSFGGWDVLGPERLVTRSEDNRLYELDGQPALALYKRYLGEKARALPASALLFPLALRRQVADREPMVRTVLAVDEGSQSMTFAGDIPQGGRAQLMYANFDRLIEGAGKAVDPGWADEAGDRETLCLAISCVGRRLVLGQRVEEEIETLAERLPVRATLFGFYSYGELSPLASGHCDLHNQTMTVTLWWEGECTPS